MFSVATPRSNPLYLLHMTPTDVAEIDPRVSCPIVAGDYMRATGFFFETENTYLITARHNVLPTSGSQLATGDFKMDFEMPDMYSKIDVYLRSGDGFSVKTLQLTDLSCVVVDSCIDVLAVQVPFNPENYGYTVFDSNDIVHNQAEPRTFDTIGFPGHSFPESGEYDEEIYAEQISGPHILSTTGPVSPTKLQLTNIENIAVTHVTGEIGISYDYTGLSGSPVLDNGLSGIHTLSLPAQFKNTETGEQTKIMLIAYWQASTLLHLLEQGYFIDEFSSEMVSEYQKDKTNQWKVYPADQASIRTRRPTAVVSLNMGDSNE